MNDILSTLNTRGSGLNLGQLASSLVTAEIAPKRQAIEARLREADLSVSALSRLRGALAGLQAGLAGTRAAGAPIGLSSSSAVAVSVTDPTRAREVTQAIEVRSLARAQVLEFGGFSSAEAAVGGGTIRLDRGRLLSDGFAPQADPQEISLPDGATLQDLARALDRLEGVSAWIVDKGDGTVSLALRGAEGAANALSLTVTPGQDGSDLARFDTSAGPADHQITAASDAEIVVDGITLRRPRNLIDDVLPGAVLALAAATPGPVTVMLGRDPQAAQAAMRELVDQINTARGSLRELTARAGPGVKAGPLAADTTAVALERQLASLTTAPLVGFGPQPLFLAQFGLRTERDGTLTLDAATFDRAFAADPAALDAVFRTRLAADTAGITVAGAPRPGAAPGSYRFALDPETGSATLGGSAMISRSLEDGRTQYLALEGPLGGVIVTPDPGLTEAEIRLGISLSDRLGSFLTRITGRNGELDLRERQIDTRRGEDDARLAALEERAALLEERYRSRFAAMEQMISQLKSTGNYMESLMEAWNRKD
ncbi:flagellar filament capping protein FliD [Plastorhodobacter daqingensis]|uniref:Flagellar hook-associated protein 2 n=1 Tax=Plastorhodobacter daqingensis TaxID=1387281 RepID=A0ABW2UKI6_9RHOB